MDAITALQVRQLTENRNGQCVSVYLPTHTTPSDAAQDHVRLKNLAERSEELLISHGMRAAEAREFVKPIRNLPSDELFWQKRSQGLALFVAPGEFHRFRLRHRFNEYVVVNRRFHVKPLLPVLVGDHEFFILALSQNTPRLIRASRFHAEEVHVEQMPEDMEQTLNYEPVDTGPQQHMGARGTNGIFHGQGNKKDTVKEDLAQYFRVVNTALHPVLRRERQPLVLAGVQHLLPIFKQVCTYAHILEDTIHGSPDHLSAQQLQEKAWPFIEQHIGSQRKAAVDKFHTLHGTGKVSDNIVEVVPAAIQGKVESLFVDSRAEELGSYDTTSGQVELHDKPRPGGDDLIDLAASETLNNRGVVFAVDRDTMPTESPVAAVFRY